MAELDFTPEFVTQLRGQEEPPAPEPDLRSTLIAASGENPDQYAETQKVARDVGAPADMIKGRVDEFKKDQQFTPEFVSMLKNDSAPLYDWLQDPENARVSHDDVNSLVEFGKSVRDIPAAIGQGQSNVTLGQLRFKELMGHASKEDMTTIEALSAREHRKLGGEGFFANIPATTAEMLPFMAESTKQGLQYGVGAAAVVAIPGSMGPQAVSPIEEGVAFTIGTGFGAFKAAAEVEAGLAYDEFIGIRGENGEKLDPGTAKTAAIIVGLGNGVLETISLGQLAKTIPGVREMKQYFTRDGVKKLLQTQAGREALTNVAKKYGQSIATESATEGMQEAMTMYVGELQKLTQDGDFKLTTLDEQVERIGGATRAGAQAAIGLGGPGTAYSAGRIIAENKKTPDPVAVADYLRNAGKNVRESALYNRSPEKFREQAFAQTDGKDFYVNSEAAVELYQSLPPETQEQLNEVMPDLYKELQEASVTGKDVPISQADYFTYLAPNDENGLLTEYTKLEADQFSVGELQQANEQIQEIMDGLREEYAADQANVAKLLNDSEKLEQRLVTELSNSGKRYSNTAKRAMASVHRAMYEAQVERYGSSAQSALEKLYGKFRIEGPAQQAKAQKPRKIEDGYIDSIRNEVVKRRKKDTKAETVDDLIDGKRKKPKKEKATPTPLISYLSGSGIERGSPIAKELAAIGVTPKAYPRLFKTDGGIKGLDNLVLSELEQALGVSGVFQDDGNGYIDQNQLLELIRNETFGDYLQTEDQRLADQQAEYMEEIINELERQGIDIETATNEEIKKALEFAAADAVVGRDGQEYNQDGVLKTETEAFKKWFGDSKVVDENGKPKVVYHGTHTISDFESFNEFSHFGNKEQANKLLADTKDNYTPYEDSDPEIAPSRIVPVYLAINNPVRIEDKAAQHYEEDYAVELENAGIITSEELNAWDSAGGKLSDLADLMLSKGYDGFVYENLFEGEGDSYIAIKPSQIKSVHNRGTFDKNDDRILYQSGKLTPAEELKIDTDFADLNPEGIEFDSAEKIAAWNTAVEIRETLWDAGYLTYDGLDATNNPDSLEDIDAGLVEEFLSSLGDYRTVEEIYQEHFDEAEGGETANEFAVSDDVLEWATKANGTTESLTEAGYIMPNGDLLDFSGKREGGPGGVRYTDHRTLNIPEAGDITGTSLMEAFISHGAIRTDGDKGAMTIGKKPTRAQKDWVATVVDTAGEAFITMHDGVRETYIRVTDGDVAINNITKFYNGQDVESDVFYQDGDGDKRGSIRFQDNGETVLKLTEASDLSTFLHESGHLWLEYWRDFTAQDDAPAAAKEDWAKLRDWMGLKDGEEIGVEQHEKFARATEAYFMDGKAPSRELRSAFQQFKAWLTKIYREIKNLNADMKPEITEVFDRMFATDTQIDDIATRDNFKPDPQILELLTKAEQEKYIKLAQENMDTAKDKLMRQAIKQHSRKETKWYKEERARVVNEVRAQVQEDRLYKALHFVVNGTDFDGNSMAGGKAHKMSRAKFKQLYGAENAKAMPRGTLADGKDALHPEFVAELFGFSDANTMVEGMMNAKPIKQKIEEEADNVMITRHGDMLNDGTIEEAAIESITDDLRAATIAYELQQISLKSGDIVVTKKQIEQLATEILFERPVGKMRPYDYYRSELKNARDVGRFLARKDYEKAAEAKRKQLLNHYLFREARAAQKDVEKTLKKWRKFGDSDKKWAKRKSMNIDYVYAIRDVLGRYGVGNPSKFDFDEWFKQLELEDPEAASTLASFVELNTAQAKNYKELNYEDFLGLKNAIEGLSELGRDIIDIELEGKKLKTKELVSRMVDQIAANNKARDKSKHYKDMGDKTKQFLGQYDKEVTRMEFILKAMDGGETNGLLNQVFINPLAKAGRKNFEMNRQMADKFMDIIKKNDGIKKRWNDKVTDTRFGDDKFTVKNIISIALNMGNEGNLEKLLAGYEWSYEDVRGLIERYLTKQDMDTVQEIWDLMEELRPDLQRVHKEVTGFPMEVVTSQPLETKWGTYRGGYFPIVYDTGLSAIGQRNSETVNVFENNFTIPTVGKGMTKSRSNFTAPLDLNFDDIAANHFRKTIQLVTHGKIVKDLSRLVQQKDFQQAIIDYSSADTYAQFKPWLQAVAGNTVYDTPIAGIEKIIRHLRVATTGIFMGFGVSTMVKQTLGMTTTMAAVTRGELSQNNFYKGTQRYAVNPAEATEFAMENSMEMASRVSYLNADVAQVIQSANKLQDWRGKITYAGMAGIGYAQLYSVDMPTWFAGYEEGMERFSDKGRAIEFADALVRQTQGSGHIKDLAKVQRGNEFQKAATSMFGTFILGVLYPRLREVGLDTRDGNAARAAITLIPLLFLPAVLEGMMGDPPEEDEEFYQWAMTKSILYGSASLPVAKNLMEAAFGDYDYAMSPTESPMNMMIGKMKSDDPDKFFEGLVIGTGVALKLPTYKPYKAIDEIIDQTSGEEEFNALEFLQIVPDADR